MIKILNIKSSEVIKEAEKKIKKQIEEDLKKSVKAIGSEAYKHAEKLSKEKLPKSLDNIYKENLYMQQISDNIVEIGIREEALWIEEGRKKGFMDELLKGSGVKTSKEGDKYRIIPFEHSMHTKSSSSSKQDMVEELKSFFKSEGIRYHKTKGLELDEKGSPRIGRIQSFDIKDMRDKKKRSVKELSPNLQGVTIYQNENPETGKVERNVMTFRVISEKHKGTGKWEHPGRPGQKILDETYEHVKNMWEKEILPALKSKYGNKG